MVASKVMIRADALLTALDSRVGAGADALSLAGGTYDRSALITVLGRAPGNLALWWRARGEDARPSLPKDRLVLDVRAVKFARHRCPEGAHDGQGASETGKDAACLRSVGPRG
jgi:hypothetical protein